MRRTGGAASSERHRSLARGTLTTLLAALYAAVPLALIATLLSPPALAARKAYSPEDLFQPLLGAELSQWLVGPIARLASEQEIDQYLGLRTDDDARSFIESFWARRDADQALPGNPALELYETRAAQADKKFSEAAVIGRHTDRGTIHVLYGEPESLEHEENRNVSGPDVELWHYSKKVEPGLDGRRPEREYRFWKLGDLTRFFSLRDLRDPRQRRESSEPGFPGGPGEPLGGRPRSPGETP